MLLKRSKKKITKHRSDKGSLILLWVMITFCLTLGFTFANYRIWSMVNYIFASFGLVLVFIGFIVRWISILKLKNAFTVDVAIGKDQELITDGIYKKIRHPSYLGLLLILVGLSICMNSVISLLVIIIPMIVTVFYRISVEEKVLIEEFGEKYVNYMTRTKKLIPILL